MIRKVLVLLIGAIVSICSNIWAVDYVSGFSKPGYVLYMNSTEYETLELADLKLADYVTLSSSNTSVVIIDGDNRLIPVGVGETFITAEPSLSTVHNFQVGVKVINPAMSNELYVRVKSGDTFPESGVIVSKYPALLLDGSPDKYVAMYNSNGTCGLRDVYGDEEIIFSPSSWTNNAVNKFILTDNYKIKNGSNYLQPNNKNVMTYGSDGRYTNATINIGDNGNLEVNFVEYNHSDYRMYVDKSIPAFKFGAVKPEFYPIQLYTLRTVSFTAPEVDGVIVCIDGTEISSENIHMDDNDHNLTFTGIPEGAKLYYKFISAGVPSQPSAAKEGTNSEWTRYVDGITVNKSSGSIEYYTESHGLKSDHKVRSFTVPTGSSCIEIDDSEAETTIYFDLSGNRVLPTDLNPGIYIKRTGAKVEKIVI